MKVKMDDYREPKYFWDPELGHDVRGTAARGKEKLDSRFFDLKGRPLSAVGYEMLSKRGSLVVLDAGCGNGRALYDIKNTAANGSSDREQRIIAIGVDRSDYRDKTQDAEVKRAIDLEKITYLVGDLKDIELPRNDIDLIYSQHALRYNSNEEAAVIIKKLAAHLAPEGQMYFDLPYVGQLSQEHTRIENLEYQETFQELRSQGYDVSEYSVDLERDRAPHTVVRITAPKNIANKPPKIIL